MWQVAQKDISYIRGDTMNNYSDVLVIVDAGHGGIDSGAVGNGLEEKDLNLKSSLYIYNRLKELGIPVVITRTNDEYLPKAKRIERIKTLTNNNPNTLLISNHINAGGATTSNYKLIRIKWYFFLFFHKDYEFYYLHI